VVEGCEDEELGGVGVTDSVVGPAAEGAGGDCCWLLEESDEDDCEDEDESLVLVLWLVLVLVLLLLLLGEEVDCTPLGISMVKVCVWLCSVIVMVVFCNDDDEVLGVVDVVEVLVNTARLMCFGT